ncbi:Retrovirus-related Pol polyprotein from transposon TNT 1-94 [Anthophora quadrimaculata]
MKSIDKDKWIKSIAEELDAHQKNKTWSLVEKPANVKVIQCKWVFRIKEEPTGRRYKSRPCAKGYAQTKGIDYDETFSPTVRYDSIRLLLSVAVQNNLKIIQLDVKTAFLYGELEETIFMTPPEGLVYEKNMVCKLNKSLYGLKQAPRCWNSKFDSVLKKFGFVNSKADQCVYIGLINNRKCYFCLYVDDGLLFSSDELALKEITEELKIIFEIKILNEPKNFIGMQIEQLDKSIFIHQTKEAIGSLMHLAIVSRPDIMFAVSLVSRFPNCYNQTHWNAVKRIFKYLKDTKEFGLWYSQTPQPAEVIGYSDADYANDLDTRRSVTGYVFIKNGAAVTWSSQRQQTVALSTTEAEFMAACAATKETMWIKQFLSDIDQYNQISMCLHLDNQSAISVIKNINFHKRCKHIEVKYHFIKEKYYQKIIVLKFVSSDYQYADILTKALSKDKFQFLRTKLGMRSYRL